MVRTLYIVGALKETLYVEPFPGGPCAPIACTWADGMVGALAVFYEQDKAEAYADGRYNVLTVEAEVPERN